MFHFVCRRAVSKQWFTSPEDGGFWEQLSLSRFGVFDHESVYEMAGPETKGAVGFDLFAIRLQQSQLQEHDI